MPILFARPLAMPSAKVVHYLSWGAVGIFFNYYVFRKYKGWWARHTYILSAGFGYWSCLLGSIPLFHSSNPRYCWSSMVRFGKYWSLRSVIVLHYQGFKLKDALCFEMVKKFFSTEDIGCIFAWYFQEL